MSRRFPVGRLGLGAAAAFGVLLFALPLIGLLVRTPWASLVDLLGEPSVRSAMGLWQSRHFFSSTSRLPCGWHLMQFAGPSISAWPRASLPGDESKKLARAVGQAKSPHRSRSANRALGKRWKRQDTSAHHIVCRRCPSS